VFVTVAIDAEDLNVLKRVQIRIRRILDMVHLQKTATATPLAFIMGAFKSRSL
jgi:hypothetical protein